MRCTKLAGQGHVIRMGKVIEANRGHLLTGKAKHVQIGLICFDKMPIRRGKNDPDRRILKG